MVLWIVHNCGVDEDGASALDTRSISVWKKTDGINRIPHRVSTRTLLQGNQSIGFGMSNTGFGIGPINGDKDLLYIETGVSDPTMVRSISGCRLSTRWVPSLCCANIGDLSFFIARW